jgi:iron complex transport system substrate-binding protein
MNMVFPSRIICLTEESVETLYLLDKSDLIHGVSQYVERPPQARQKPIVSQFLRSDIEAIAAIGPDLVIGFSDIQKDIARELIGRGLNVLVTNQRSLSEILDYILFLGRIVDAPVEAAALVESFHAKMEQIRQAAAQFPRRPRVYFEEWDRPRLSGIRWVSELIEVCGGENIFADRVGALAREREVDDAAIVQKNPELIIGCWCGKKVNLESIAARPGYQQITAVKTGQIKEVSPAIFLQPGPALFLDGLDQLFNLLKEIAYS